MNKTIKALDPGMYELKDSKLILYIREDTFDSGRSRKYFDVKSCIPGHHPITYFSGDILYFDGVEEKTYFPGALANYDTIKKCKAAFSAIKVVRKLKQ